MTILLSPWFWLAAMSAVAAFLGHGWLGEHDARIAFQSSVEALGKEQERRTKDRIAYDKLNKEKTDAQISGDRTRIRSLGRELLDARSRSGYLPAPTGSTTNPDRACFDRAELERAFQQLDAGVQGLLGEGDEARAVINRLKEWRQGWRIE